MLRPAYSDIYKRLVANPNDTLGTIAYSFYKLEKIEFIERTIEETKAPPTPEAMAAFHTSTTTSTALDGYRAQATALAQGFINETVSARVQELEEENARDFETRLRSLMPPGPPGFWYGVAQGVMASIMFSFLLATLVLLLWSAHLSMADVIKAAFDGRPPDTSAPKGTPK